MRRDEDTYDVIKIMVMTGCLDTSKKITKRREK